MGGALNIYSGNQIRKQLKAFYSVYGDVENGSTERKMFGADEKLEEYLGTFLDQKFSKMDLVS